MSERFDVVRLRDFGKVHLVGEREGNGRRLFCGRWLVGTYYIGQTGEKPSDVCANCWRHHLRLLRYGGRVG